MGGAIFNSDSGWLSTVDCWMYLNQSLDFMTGGGAVLNSGTAFVTGGQVFCNYAQNGGLGGGFFNDPNSTLTINGTQIYANWADTAGGILDRGTLSMVGGTLYNNTAVNVGGLA